MSEGLTAEQARDKIYQDLIKERKMDSAKALRQYQDIIRPVNNRDKTPPFSPPELSKS